MSMQFSLIFFIRYLKFSHSKYCKTIQITEHFSTYFAAT